MALRKDVTVEGIPIVWQTNLSDDDIRSLYTELACDPDLAESQLNVEELRISLSLFNKSIPFKEGACLCVGFNNRLTAIYRTEAEWSVWQAHRSEVDELEAEREQEKQVEILLFCSHDDHLKSEIEARLTARDWPSVCPLLSRRRDLRRTHEHLHFPLYAKGRWEIDQEMIDTLVRIPDTEVATRFLQDQDTRAACFEWYWESYLQFHFRRIEAYLDVQGDPNWLARVRQCPEYEQHLLLTKGIQDAAITRFPRSGYLLKRVVLFWESHDRYLEAITYCRWAIEHGLTDDTKRGFPWRLRRIENKLRKMERHNQAVEASVASTPQPQR